MRNIVWTAACLGLVIGAWDRVVAGAAFPEPENGGWDYIFNGDAAAYALPGFGFQSLDGTWSHDNPSDEWDGSALGGEFSQENRPGGVEVVTTNSLSFLRMQDAGDARGFGFPDPGSNRRLFFGHNASGTNQAPGPVLNDGFTLTFRARIPVGGTMDPLFPAGGSSTNAYPAGGDGFVPEDFGRGQVMIGQAGGGVIGFSLTVAGDTLTPGGAAAGVSGLTMNSRNGNFVADEVGWGKGESNVLELDPTQWHEFWIAVRADPELAATHEVFVFVDGATNAAVFKVTAAFTSDFPLFNYVGIGLPSRDQSAAMDLDFIAYKPGLYVPEGASAPPPVRSGEPVTLGVPALDGGQIAFSFQAEAGGGYRVEYQDALGGTTWNTLTRFENTAAGPVEVRDDAGPGNRFYRIVTE